MHVKNVSKVLGLVRSLGSSMSAVTKKPDSSGMGPLGALGGSEACGARWALATLLLAPLAATTSGYSSVLGIIVLATFIVVAGEYFNAEYI
ncbi:hypothetical protein EVAR_84681_1 [Eumeta japonica]|uniref:Uncharacterized protein n=1 Tax=Eumeta variegata TaxID=151549 RepID=A0A4C2A0E7_EUMVA|nr:hypothetical protein EVAR_84681_1 [Eumeta japonica]